MELHAAEVGAVDLVDVAGRLVGLDAYAVGQRVGRRRIERQLAKVADREAKLHDELAAAASDYGRAAEINVKLQAVLDEKEGLELEWLEAAELLS